EASLDALWTETEALIDDAVAFARQSPVPAADEATIDVFAD
ncbi:MAG TPA: pyruvate dehydrogenase (acetyl-transferring) E1 component subunit alpha, partial [Armatimonadetes bacterium]|nr:pyruvate dehydrogenase (acetyl-transferring) E1 component subunit alpha [Armatimonadota bacterium]